LTKNEIGFEGLNREVAGSRFLGKGGKRKFRLEKRTKFEIAC